MIIEIQSLLGGPRAHSILSGAAVITIHIFLYSINIECWK